MSSFFFKPSAGIRRCCEFTFAMSVSPPGDGISIPYLLALTIFPSCFCSVGVITFTPQFVHLLIHITSLTLGFICNLPSVLALASSLLRCVSPRSLVSIPYPSLCEHFSPQHFLYFQLLDLHYFVKEPCDSRLAGRYISAPSSAQEAVWCKGRSAEDLVKNFTLCLLHLHPPTDSKAALSPTTFSLDSDVLMIKLEWLNQSLIVKCGQLCCFRCCKK